MKKEENVIIKNAILEVCKAFESTKKTICDKKGYTYDKAKGTAQKLISILKKNEFYPSYMNFHFISLRTTLETGLFVVEIKFLTRSRESSCDNIG